MAIAGGAGALTHQDIPKQFIHVNDVLWAYSRQFGITKLEKIVDGGEIGQDSLRPMVRKCLQITAASLTKFSLYFRAFV